MQEVQVPAWQSFFPWSLEPLQPPHAKLSTSAEETGRDILEETDVSLQIT
jgi:hypothetical protein